MPIFVNPQDGQAARRTFARHVSPLSAHRPWKGGRADIPATRPEKENLAIAQNDRTAYAAERLFPEALSAITIVCSQSLPRLMPMRAAALGIRL